MARNTQHVHIIASTQDQMLAQPEAYSTHYVPSVVSATTATTPSRLANSAADTCFEKLEGSIETLVQQMMTLSQNQSQGQQFPVPTSNRNNSRNGHCPRRPIRDPNGPWRQWKYWCYTCGTNLSHDLPDCHKTYRQKPSHHQYKDSNQGQSLGWEQ